MPTRRRRESGTGLYHVVVKGINREMIFDQQREKVYYKKVILKYMKTCKIEIYAYCIMSNHAHFIIRAEIQELSRYMARVLAEYALYYNYKHQRNGHVFQNRFLSECIENEKYYWNCLRYIHLNPVKANMVKEALNYKFSSIGEYHDGEVQLLSDKAVVMYQKRFEDFDTFNAFHSGQSYEVFTDTGDEIFKRQLEIAVSIAGAVAEKNGMTLLNEVFEEKSVREEYICQIIQILKVSQNKAKKLCSVIQNKLVCN